eukprot:TRINITY_DN2669_c0_g2_i1.p1 TRINITY_DN2669_c0_g2~~TRINITY_DN2669_c0_g2_i1.p1  ORF type:complete len:370 (+),score=80.52 TRINITY_DN2669_c0_g2_i1:34-1143(+)
MSSHNSRRVTAIQRRKTRKDFDMDSDIIEVMKLKQAEKEREKRNRITYLLPSQNIKQYPFSEIYHKNEETFVFEGYVRNDDDRIMRLMFTDKSMYLFDSITQKIILRHDIRTIERIHIDQTHMSGFFLHIQCLFNNGQIESRSKSKFHQSYEKPFFHANDFIVGQPSDDCAVVSVHFFAENIADCISFVNGTHRLLFMVRQLQIEVPYLVRADKEEDDEILQHVAWVSILSGKNKNKVRLIALSNNRILSLGLHKSLLKIDKLKNSINIEDIKCVYVDRPVMRTHINIVHEDHVELEKRLKEEDSENHPTLDSITVGIEMTNNTKDHLVIFKFRDMHEKMWFMIELARCYFEKMNEILLIDRWASRREL